MVNVGLNYNLYATRFNILNNSTVQPGPILGYPLSTPAPVGTAAEQSFLRQYGKVFYYKVEFGDGTGNGEFTVADTYYVLALEADISNDFAEWQDLNISDTPFNGKLHYHKGITGLSYPAVGASSREIIVEPVSVPHPKFRYSDIPFPTTSHGFEKSLLYLPIYREYLLTPKEHRFSLNN